MAGESTGSGIAAGIGIGLTIIAPVLLVIFIVIGGSAAAQPNANGATTQQNINPNLATSPLSAQLANFDRFKDVNGYLNKNSGLLTDLQTRMAVISSSLSSGGAKGISAGNIATLQTTVIPAIMADINIIRTQVAAGTPAGASTATADLMSQLNKLQTLSQNVTAAKVAQIALNFANFNKNGTGTTKYGAAPIIFTAGAPYPSLVDCSGFVSYVLLAAGALNTGEQYAVQGMATTLTKDPRFSVIINNNGGSIDEPTILASVQPGDIILSNGNSSITTNALDSNGDRENHAVIYLGLINGVPMIADSTDWNGKSGPQTDTLDDRVQHHGTVQIILRPNDTSATTPAQ